MLKKENTLIKNVQISYFDNQNESSDISILFIHGNSCSSELFSNQFNALELSGFRLIAIDLFGHGESENISSDSILNSYQKLIWDFIEEKKLKRVIVVGHSLGGHIALQMLKEEKREEVIGTMIFCTPPLNNPPEFEKAFQSREEINLFFKEVLSIDEAKSMSRCICEDDSIYLDEIADIIGKTSPLARKNLVQTIGRLDFLDEFALISNAKFKVAILFGVNDKIVSPDYFLNSISWNNVWRKQAISLDGGHVLQLEHSKSFNQSLLSYIDEEIRKNFSLWHDQINEKESFLC